MPVDSRSKEYDSKLSQWRTVRDVIEGEIAIKNGGASYLTKPSGQKIDDYENYKKRAHFFDATSRTADGLHGNIFQREPLSTGEVDDSFIELLNNVDAMGTSLTAFASDITWDAMQTNWGGILVDYQQTPPGISRADALKKGYRAYLRWYTAESVINWRYEVRGGRTVLALVVLQEPYSTQINGDKFTSEIKNKYRVLVLDKNGNYYQELYDEANELKTPEIINMQIEGMQLDFIPFFPCPGKTPEKSMLLGLAFENIGHYEKTAYYENGLFYAGVPTPVCLNREAPKDSEGNIEPVTLGGSSMLFIKAQDGVPVDVKFLEFTGAGMEQILKALQSCEERMAILGARIISAEKKGVETAEAARIHRAGENGVLATFARNISENLTIAVRLMARWNGVDESICEGWSYHLNTDYDSLLASSQLIATVLSGRMNNEVPRKVVFRVLQKAELVDEGMTYEEYIEDLERDNTGSHLVIQEDDNE